MSERVYPIKWVVQKTGLSPHVLRVWERRYEAVSPARTDSNRRVYSDAELHRLELLAKLTRAGHGIGQIANLPDEELESMAASIQREDVIEGPAVGVTAVETLLQKAWGAVTAMDLDLLRDVLERAGVELGDSALTEQLMVPLIEKIGRGWENGELSIAEEHAASVVIREVLFLNSRPYAESTSAPGIVITTPAGQFHELGAALVSSIARRRGWKVTYLGASVPAEEIVRAAVRSHSLAVALSIVYPADDPRLPDELRRLKRLLPIHVALFLGGRSANGYYPLAEEIGAVIPTGLDEFKTGLDRLREKAASASLSNG